MYTNDRSKWTVYAIAREWNPSFAKEYKASKLRLKYVPEDDGWRAAIHDDDSFTSKKFFPYHFDKEGKEEFIESHWAYINSPYDCTGRLFTVSIDMYETDNGTWVYHRKSLDV